MYNMCDLTKVDHTNHGHRYDLEWFTQAVETEGVNGRNVTSLHDN